MLKIWFVLKHMGLRTAGPPIAITTSSPTDALKRLFSFGDPEGKFFVPFAHTPRFALMKSDAARSIIQTNVRRWATSGSVVRTDPTAFLDFNETENDRLLAKTGRSYPVGLGHGKDGFARSADDRVSLPQLAYAVWYSRQSGIPDDGDANTFLLNMMRDGLSLTPAEEEAVFLPDVGLPLSFQATPVTDSELSDIVSRILSHPEEPQIELIAETFQQHSARIRSMVSRIASPTWLRADPADLTHRLLTGGNKAVLLYGPPRTGKTRAIDQYCPRTDPRRETIQIHDGWGYDEMIVGLRPTPSGQWEWQHGVLRVAIEGGKTFIVLEEINRTNFTQALGEVFSLLEPAYRGSDKAITLRDASSFFLPEDVMIIATMNTVDRSTEEVDDALLGRVTAIEFYPRVESLHDMLVAQGFDQDTVRQVAQLFTTILDFYPLGHGYFADLRPSKDAGTHIDYYLSRIRPVLQSHLESYRDAELATIDNAVDQLFGV